jgi:hypothetical protein
LHEIARMRSERACQLTQHFRSGGEDVNVRAPLGV